MKWFLVYLFVASNAPNGMGAIVGGADPFPDLASCRAALTMLETKFHNGMRLVCAGNDAVARATLQDMPNVYLPR